MRLCLILLSFAAAACRTTDHGTPPTAIASVPEEKLEAGSMNATAADQKAEPAAPKATTTDEQVEPQAASTSLTESAGQGFAPTAEGGGTDCTLDVALSCTDTEVDGCLTGQATVHRCVSMNAP